MSTGPSRQGSASGALSPSSVTAYGLMQEDQLRFWWQGGIFSGVIGRLPHRWLARTAHALLALVILSAVPGVAVGSLPVPPPPSHACCAAASQGDFRSGDAPAPMEGACETAPCCIAKPAPKGNAVLTSGLPAPAVAHVETLPSLAPPAEIPARCGRCVAPRARSAPLFLLFVSLLN